ncbi:hypothetical protein FRC04_003496 [Tulasnella sp. 424]|nr:hypothetical protein FRC04_003496 [Tulasnella sp. 424]
MKPPTEEAVAEALSILIGSVNQENDSQFVSQEIPAAFPPVSNLPDNVEALTIVKSCIDKELEKLIISMQHRRNLAAPIHKLPVEVLVAIFSYFTASSSLTDDRNLLELTTVNKLWYDAIVHSPQLWTVIDSDFSLKVTKLVIQRSKNLPFSLIWDTTGYDESHQPELSEMLGVLIPNSARLKSIEMTVPDRSDPSVRRLLESNMPHLEKLRVEAILAPGTEGELLGKFELWDGPPLREISLNRTSLSSWSSPRLSGLVKLYIIAPRQPPSIEQLLVILSNSTQLEMLDLREWYRSGPYDWKPPSDRPIILPHLVLLIAENIDHPYAVALLTSVYTPSTLIVGIRTTFHGYRGNPLEEVCSPGNDQLAALLGLANFGSLLPRTPEPITVSVTTSKLRIERFGSYITIGLEEEHSTKVADQLGQFFLALPQTPEVELSIDAASSWRPWTLDLLPWSRSLCKLAVTSAVVCRAVLKQLAQETMDPTTGVTSWVCPNLTSIRLVYPLYGDVDEVAELDRVALEALVRARWYNKAAVEQLSEFTTQCKKAKYPSIWSRATFLKESISCVSLLNFE